MKPKKGPGPLVLAIYPATIGFGFALFEGPLRPVDWAVKRVRWNKNATCLKEITALIDFYLPDVIVIDDYTWVGSKRGVRTKRLIDSVAELASQKNIPLCGYSRNLIRTYFANYQAKSKYEIALVIATWMPRFRLRLPRPRKPWAAEGYTMPIFDAISLALTHYYYQRQRNE
jgi:hypothetical protein